MSKITYETTLTYSGLMKKSKDDLAHLVLMLCDSNGSLHRQVDGLVDGLRLISDPSKSIPAEPGTSPCPLAISRLINDPEYLKRIARQTLLSYSTPMYTEGERSAI